MFTGIVETVGKIKAIQDKGGDKRFTIQTGELDLSDVALGDSIAVNGICLTAVVLHKDAFEADVSNETLRCTIAGDFKTGTEVNLEKAMLPTTRFGGHIVSGHVDGLGKVESISPDGRSQVYTISAPENLSKYIAAKGSITINGVSLTVNKVDGHQFEINLVPHTLEMTTLKNLKKGDAVNLEVDIIARYLERLLLGKEQNQQGVTLQKLFDSGFVK